VTEVTVHHGDSREVLKSLTDSSIDAVVTDPPYALVSIQKRFGKPGSAPAKGNEAFVRASRGFMNQTWDTGDTAHDPAFWREVYRVLKPGAHVVAFAGTRTYHRLACAVEDAGLEMRDMVLDILASDTSARLFMESLDEEQLRAFVRVIDDSQFGGMLAWAFGSGFPKSHDVSKGIDKAAGAEREKTGEIRRASIQRNGDPAGAFASHPEETKRVEITAPATAAAKQWEGWGTALKPAFEPIVLARKPLATTGVNVLEVVEFGLRNQGVEGDIRWTSEAVGAAAKASRSRRSSSTGAPPAAETSAERAAAPGTASDGMPTAPSSGLHGTAGARPTQEDRASSRERPTPNSGQMFSPPTAADAPAAVRPSLASSPLTTSKVAGQLTESPSTARSTPNSDDRAIRPDTVSFAGIATGLTGSLERVHISRNPDGSFVWPKALPKRLEPSPLTVAANVLAHGTGALNIGACRIEGPAWSASGEAKGGETVAAYGDGLNNAGRSGSHDLGRWPANVVHDGSDEVEAAFPSAPGQQRPLTGEERAHRTKNAYGDFGRSDGGCDPRGDTGSAARFFFGAKADPEDRLGSKHPTVKPVRLMRWLCRLVTPPKVIAFICETCDNPLHEDANLQGLPSAADEPATSDLLLREMQSDGGNSASPSVQGLRQADESSAAEALLAGVPSGLSSGDRADTSPAPLRGVRNGVQAQEGRRQNVLRSGVRGEGVGHGEAQAADQNERGLLATLSAGSPDGGQDGLRHGAPAGDGGETWPSATAKRSGPPPERGQGGQRGLQPYADEQDATRQPPEDAKEPGARLSALRGTDPSQQLCPKCGGGLTRTERPGLILDPFAGTGTTGIAAMAEGFECILIEREESYHADILRRLAWARGEGRLTAQEMVRQAAPEEWGSDSLFGSTNNP
jgi:DNA methylase